MLLIFLNLSLLALWIYIASSFGRGREAFFNFYINRVRRLLFAPITFVQNLFPKLPDWGAAIILFALTATALVLFHKHSIESALSIPAELPRSLIRRRILYESVLLLGRPVVWFCGLNLIRTAMIWRLGRGRVNNTLECLDTVCFPLSRLKLPLSVAASVAVIIALSAAIPDIAGSCGYLMMGVKAIGGEIETGQSVKLAIGGLLGTLMVLRSLIGAGIIASIAGLLIGQRAITGMADEWLASITRIITTRRLTFAMFDFTPVIIYIAAGYIYDYLVETIMNF